METEQEKKPIVGSEFLTRSMESALKKQTGEKGKPKAEDPAETYDKKTKEVEAQHRYVTTVDSLMNPPSVQDIRNKHEQQLQEQALEAKRQADEYAARERERLETERMEAHRQAQEEHDRRVETEKQLQLTQHQMMMEKLEELRHSQKPLQQQLDEYMGFADKMGFVRASDTPAGSDPRIGLELEKMKLDAERERREFEWKMEQDRRTWDMEMEKMRQEREFRKAELAQQERKDEMFASLPQRIGGAIAQGLIERDQGGAPSSGHIGQAPRQTKVYKIDIGEGRAGEIACPDCQGPVGVGPTSTSAGCVNCNTQFTVSRHPTPGEGPPPPSEPPEQEIPQYYEEDE